MDTSTPSATSVADAMSSKGSGEIGQALLKMMASCPGPSYESRSPTQSQLIWNPQGLINRLDQEERTVHIGAPQKGFA